MERTADSEQDEVPLQRVLTADWTVALVGLAVALAPMSWEVALMMGPVQDAKLVSASKAVRNLLHPSEMPEGMRTWVQNEIRASSARSLDIFSSPMGRR